MNQGVVANENKWISAKIRLFGVAPPMIKADNRVVDLPVSFPDDPSSPYDPAPSPLAPALEGPALATVTAGVSQNVTASSGLPLDFSTGVTGPVSLLFLQAQVGILDSHIHSMG